MGKGWEDVERRLKLSDSAKQFLNSKEILMYIIFTLVYFPR